jgi:hypothetical protein
MRRKTGRRSALLLLVILTTAGGALAAALKREPDFYSAAESETASVEISSQSSRLMTRVQDLINDVNTKAEWGATFTANELNCFLHEYAREVNERLGGQFHTPRVHIDGDRVRIGVRSGRGFASGVLWIELRAWLVASEPNCLAVEIASIRFGLIPITEQSILDRITDVVWQSNVEVTWYRHQGKPVGMFRFFADQARRLPKQLRAVQIRDGQLTIAGRSSVDNPLAPAGVGPNWGMGD